MARISRRRLMAVVAVPVLASGLGVGLTSAFGSAVGTGALSQTVGVPGTPVTAPCSVTVTENVTLGQQPGFSESGTCKI